MFVVCSPVYRDDSFKLLDDRVLASKGQCFVCIYQPNCVKGWSGTCFFLVLTRNDGNSSLHTFHLFYSMTAC
jgi:hypothetical protein